MSLRALIVPFASTVAGVLPTFLAGGLMVQIASELGIGESAFGLAFAGYFATAALGSAALGRLAEGAGARAALVVAPLVSALVQLGIAGCVHQYGVLLALLALAGSSNALAQPAANLALANAVPLSRQGLAFGLKQSAIPVSTLLGGLAVPLVASTVGWRWAFVGGAALAVAAAAAAWAFPPPVPSVGAVHRASRTPAKRGTLLLLAVGIGLGAAAAGAMGAFLVSTGVAAGLSESMSGTMLTIGSACGLAVRLGAGVFADRWRGRPLRLSVGLMSLGVVGVVALGAGDPRVHIVATVVAFGAGWAWPGLFNLAVVRAYREAPARATGVTQTGTYVGAVAGPLLFGVVAEVSYLYAWVGAAAALSAAAVALHFADRRLPVRTTSQPC